MVDPTVNPRSPFAGFSLAAAKGKSGVIVADRDGLGIATVLPRKGQTRALEQRVSAHFGIELPRGPRRETAGGTAFVGTAPEAWLTTCELGGNAFALSLREVIGDLASVSDQSDGYAVLRLTGLKLRDTLAKIIPIDLHPRAFRPGDVASTAALQIGATLWRLEDGPDGSPMFDIAVFRSLTGSLWHALSESAAEVGLVMACPRRC